MVADCMPLPHRPFERGGEGTFSRESIRLVSVGLCSTLAPGYPLPQTVEQTVDDGHYDKGQYCRGE